MDNESTDKENNFTQLLTSFIPADTTKLYAERTGNKGLHIFLINDLNITEVSKHRWVNVYKGVNYAIDIFIGSSTTDMNGVVVTKPHADDLCG